MTPAISLISLIVVLCVVGVVLWAVNAYIPMQPNIKKLLNIAVTVIVAIWLLQSFGLLGPLNSVRVGG